MSVHDCASTGEDTNRVNSAANTGPADLSYDMSFSAADVDVRV